MKTQNHASCVETNEYMDINANVLHYFQFKLSEFPRSNQIASQYAFFRPKAVEWSVEPFFDTYQEASGGASSVPQIMWVMNRSGQFNLTTKAQLEDMGAMPRKFIRNHIIKYKPNTLQLMAEPSRLGINANGSGGDFAPFYSGAALSADKWIPYQSTAIDNGTPAADLTVFNALYQTFFGHIMLVEQQVSVVDTVARIRCRVHWEFKDPLTTLQPALQLKTLKAVPKSIPNKIKDTSDAMEEDL